MTYVALLRGINVGGNNKVEMRALRATFERAGMLGVRTYINSGNVVFRSESDDARAVEAQLEAAIAQDFGRAIKVLLVDAPCMRAMIAELPDEWTNDGDSKCDVMFLWEDVDDPSVVDQLTIKPEIDHVRYVPGAVFWHVDRANAAKSGAVKVVGTRIYKRMTVRNCNTLRKLAELVEQVDAEA